MFLRTSHTWKYSNHQLAQRQPVCTVVSKKTLVYDVCQSRQPETESGNAQWRSFRTKAGGA